MAYLDELYDGWESLVVERFDLCANSATLDDEQKEFANSQLWARLEDVAQLYRQHGAAGNLYLGGSVGLRQPALYVKDGKTAGLKSDLDLFYLLRELPPKSAEQAFLEAVASLPQDIDVSVHVMPAVEVNEQLYSLAFDDLVDSVSRPVAQGFPFPLGEQAYRFQAKTGTAMAVCMLATAAAPFYVTSHAYANVPDDRIERDVSTEVKAAISILRMPCYELLGSTFSYRGLLELSEQGYFDDLCPREMVEEVVRRREQVGSATEPLPVSLHDLFCRSASRLLGLTLDTPAPELALRFSETYCQGESREDSLHRILLLLGLWVWQPVPELLEQVGEELLRPRCPLDVREMLDPLLDSNPEPDAVREALPGVLSATLQSITERIGAQLTAILARTAAPST